LEAVCGCEYLTMYQVKMQMSLQPLKTTHWEANIQEKQRQY